MNRAFLAVAISIPYAALTFSACGNDTNPQPDGSADTGPGSDGSPGNDGASTDAPASDTGPLPGDSSVATAVTVSWGAECALMGDGTVRCWGPGANLGQPGDAAASNMTNRPTPLLVPGLTGIVQIASALEVTCALSNVGAVYCWGDNTNGEVGVDGSDQFGIVFAPRQVPLPAAASYVDVGFNGSCARLVTGEVDCWGHAANDGIYGVVTADGGPVPVSIPPTPMSGVTSPLDIALGFQATCVLFDGGEARCVGNNGNGELGNTTVSPLITIRTFDAAAPVQLSGPATSLGTAAGPNQCAVLASGAVQCWGSNGSAIVAPLEAGTPITAPQTIPTIANATRVSIGSRHACAIDTAGDVYCWGENTTGGVGAPLDSGTTDYNPPYKVQGLPSKAIGISAGGDLLNSDCSYCGQSCAVLDTGAVYCWGSNDHGRLGRGADAGAFSADPTPQPVAL